MLNNNLNEQQVVLELCESNVLKRMIQYTKNRLPSLQDENEIFFSKYENMNDFIINGLDDFFKSKKFRHRSCESIDFDLDHFLRLVIQEQLTFLKQKCLYFENYNWLDIGELLFKMKEKYNFFMLGAGAHDDTRFEQIKQTILSEDSFYIKIDEGLDGYINKNQRKFHYLKGNNLIDVHIEKNLFNEYSGIYFFSVNGNVYNINVDKGIIFESFQVEWGKRRNKKLPNNEK